MVYSDIKIATIGGNKNFIPTKKQDMFLKCMGYGNVVSRLTRQQGFTTVQLVSSLEAALKSPCHIVHISHNNTIGVNKIATLHGMINSAGYGLFETRCIKNRIELKNRSVISISSLENLGLAISGSNLPAVIYIEAMVNTQTIDSLINNVQMLIQRGIKFSIGLQCSPPDVTNILVAKVFDNDLSTLMTMLYDNATPVDFPNTNKIMIEGMSPSQHNIEYELFGFRLLSKGDY